MSKKLHLEITITTLIIGRVDGMEMFLLSQLTEVPTDTHYRETYLP